MVYSNQQKKAKLARNDNSFFCCVSVWVRSNGSVFKQRIHNKKKTISYSNQKSLFSNALHGGKINNLSFWRKKTFNRGVLCLCVRDQFRFRSVKKKEEKPTLNFSRILCVMCAKIRDNKLQNDNFIHIALKKRSAIHPSTMFRIESVQQQGIICVPMQSAATVNQIIPYSCYNY